MLAILVLSVFAGCSTNVQEVIDQANKTFLVRTGLRPTTLQGDASGFYEKTHRGVPMLFRAQAPKVWERYTARLTAGEAARAVGGVIGYLAGQRRHIHSNIVGSPYDRLLNRVLGDPMTIVVIGKHGKARAPRLDILSPYCSIVPEDPQPPAFTIDGWAGAVNTRDLGLAQRVEKNGTLMEQLRRLHNQYIRVDEFAVTFVFSGSETELAGLINDHGSYENLVNAMMDTVSALAQSF